MLISPESGQFDRGPWAAPNHRTVTGVISVISGTFHRTPDSTPVKIPAFSIYLCGPQSGGSHPPSDRARARARTYARREGRGRAVRDNTRRGRARAPNEYRRDRVGTRTSKLLGFCAHPASSYGTQQSIGLLRSFLNAFRRLLSLNSWTPVLRWKLIV